MNEGNDIAFLAATQLHEAYRRRTLSPLEVIDAFLDRIERLEPTVNAFTLVLAEEARQAAREAESTLTQGESLLPLLGVPLTIKDLTLTAGVRTTYGSRAFADFVPDVSALVVDRLLGAGGIVLGKTTTPEFGHKGVTSSPLTGTTNNPWNPAYTVGGSSGGAAAAVAAGMCVLAQGSDAGGSVRIPASCCGVVGFKPTLGRIPYILQDPVFATLSHLGPITRTVDDAALMLTVMAGPHGRDPFSIPERTDYLEAIRSPPAVRTIAYSPNLGLGPVDNEVVSHTRAAAQALAEQLGAELEEAAPDAPSPHEAMTTLWSTAMQVQVEDVIAPRIALDEIDPTLRGLAEQGKRYSGAERYRAILFRGNYYRAMADFFERYDLLVTPTIALPPFPHPDPAPGPSRVAGEPIDPFLGWLLTYPFNLTGQPAISMPCGFSEEGLPIGVQIAGPRLADVTVLAAARAYEQATQPIPQPPLE